MTIKEILNKVVVQALANGWDIFDAQRDKRATWPPSAENVVVTESSDGRQGWDLFIQTPHIYEPIADRWEAEDLLFDINFARALWGEQGFPGEFTGKYPNPLEKNNVGHGAQRGWKHHLQELAICEDRFKYLEDHLL